MSTPELPESLSHKVGPLPAGVWLLAIAGGLAVAVFVRRSAEAPAADPAAASEFGAGLDNTQAGAGNLSSAYVPSNPTATGSTAETFASNDDWQRAALVRLVARGYAPLTASNALDAYLNGARLSAQQAAIVDEALRLAGAPPVSPPPPESGQTNTPTPTLPKVPSVPVPTVPTAPKPSTPRKPKWQPRAPKPAPKPKPVQHYTVRAGDTLGGIAAAHHTTSGKLYAANRAAIEAAAKHHGKGSSSGGHWIFPGTSLVIP